MSEPLSNFWGGSEIAKVLLSDIDKLAYEGGGSVKIRNAPGGSEAIWWLIENGYLIEDYDYVSLTEKAIKAIASKKW